MGEVKEDSGEVDRESPGTSMEGETDVGGQEVYIDPLLFERDEPSLRSWDSNSDRSVLVFTLSQPLAPMCSKTEDENSPPQDILEVAWAYYCGK